jgi:hypothetical protein
MRRSPWCAPFLSCCWPPTRRRARRAVSIADRAARLQAAAFAASHVPKILELYAEWYQDESLPIAYRRAAGDRLLDRALGRPTQQVEDVGDNVVEKRVIEVRWLPPDPNDHSRYHGDLSDERPAIDVEPKQVP